MSRTLRPTTYRNLLANREFVLLWLAQAASSFGDWLALFALFNLVAFRLNGNASEVAWISIATIVPSFLVAPVAGVFVDRWDVKRVMVSCDLIRAVFAILLSLTTRLHHVYFLVFAASVVACFFVPGLNLAMPALVPKAQLIVANALSQQTTQLNRILSPVAAGALVAWGGERACFYVDSFTFIVSALLVSMIKHAGKPANPSGHTYSVLKQFNEGLVFLARHRTLLLVTLAVSGTVFALGAFNALAAVYVRDILRARTNTFGALVSLTGVGSVVGAFFAARVGQGWSKIRMITIGILGLALAVFAFGAIHRTSLALIAAAWAGAAASWVLLPSQTLVQQETPHSILGRISSAMSSLVTLSQMVSMGAAAEAADRIGIRKVYFGVSLLLVVIAGSICGRTARIPPPDRNSA